MSVLALPERKILVPPLEFPRWLRLPRGVRDERVKRMLTPLGGGGLTPLGVSAIAQAFSPADIAGLKLWLKADAGLYQERTGASATTPASADGDPVGSWLDQSGQANHCTAPSDAARPTLKLAIQNGRNIVRSDTSNDVLKTPSLNFLSTCTVYAAVKGKNTGGPTYLFDNDSANRLILGTTGPNNKPFWYDGSYHEFGTTSATFQTLAWVLPAGATSEILRNGSSLGTATRSASTSTAQFGLFAKPDGTNGTGFDLCEFLIYNTAHSASDLANVFGYLNSRWAIY